MKTLTLVLLMAATACSTAKPKTEPTTNDHHETSFEISYWTSGHDHRRLTGSSSVSGQSGESSVASYLEKNLIEQSVVKSEKYEHFFAKLVTFSQTTHRSPSSDADCHTPYSITLKIDEKTQTSKGCRLDNEGAVNKLIREGEFLLYSKK